MIQAVILCGGRGSRLGALTADCPKPLQRVGDGPFLDILLRQVKRAGCTHVLLLAGYRADLVEHYAIQSRVPFDLDVRVVTEPEPLGTGGALRNAYPHLHGRFLLLNGDTFFDIDPLVLLNQLDASTATLAKVAVREPQGRDWWTSWTNGGVYALRREFIFLLPDKGELEGGFAYAGDRAEPVVFYGCYFIDIGTPAELARARRELPGREVYHQAKEAGSGVHTSPLR